MRQLSAADDAHAREFVEQMLTTELLADFKGSVDAMRHLIWIYVEAVSNSNGPEIVQSARLRRAVDMLRVLHLEGAPSSLDRPETFFEHVQNVVDNYGEGRILEKERDAA